MPDESCSPALRRWLPAGVAVLSLAAVIATSPHEEDCRYQLAAPLLQANLTPLQPEIVHRYQAAGSFELATVSVRASSEPGQPARIVVRTVPEPEEGSSRDAQPVEAELLVASRPTFSDEIYTHAFSVSVQLIEGAQVAVELEVNVQGNSCAEDRFLTVEHD